jgi:2-polyprenyl-3-methyl-5-hydroxy-6-metoxy-1,4-benzoquinol methylase
MKITNSKLSSYLKSKIPQNASFIEKIKIGYRPYICPFGELLEYIPKNSSVFDIGCGSGMFLSLVAEFKNPQSVGGIEISKDLIENSLQIFKNIKPSPRISLNVFNGYDIPNEIKNYNFIFLIDVLHHVPKNDQINFLRRIYEKMPCGSKLILKDINAENFILSKFNKIHDFLFSGSAGNELPMTEVKEKLQKIGFKILSITQKTTFVYPHYTIVCEKQNV